MLVSSFSAMHPLLTYTIKAVKLAAEQVLLASRIALQVNNGFSYISTPLCPFGINVGSED